MNNKWDKLNQHHSSHQPEQDANLPAKFEPTEKLPVPLRDIDRMPTDFSTALAKNRTKKEAFKIMMEGKLEQLRIAVDAQKEINTAEAELVVKIEMEKVHEHWLDFIEKLGVRQVQRIKEIGRQYDAEYTAMFADIMEADMPEFMRDLRIKLAEAQYIRRLTELYEGGTRGTS